MTARPKRRWLWLTVALFLMVGAGLWWNAKARRERRDAWISQVETLGISVQFIPWHVGRTATYKERAKQFLSGGECLVLLEDGRQAKDFLRTVSPDCPTALRIQRNYTVSGETIEAVMRKFPGAQLNSVVLSAR